MILAVTETITKSSNTSELAPALDCVGNTITRLYGMLPTSRFVAQTDMGCRRRLRNLWQGPNNIFLWNGRRAVKYCSFSFSARHKKEGFCVGDDRKQMDSACVWMRAHQFTMNGYPCIVLGVVLEQLPWGDFQQLAADAAQVFAGVAQANPVHQRMARRQRGLVARVSWNQTHLTNDFFALQKQHTITPGQTRCAHRGTARQAPTACRKVEPTRMYFSTSWSATPLFFREWKTARLSVYLGESIIISYFCYACIRQYYVIAWPGE